MGVGSHLRDACKDPPPSQEVSVILESQRLRGAIHTGVSEGVLETWRYHSYWRLGGATHTGGLEVPLILEARRCHS